MNLTNRELLNAYISACEMGDTYGEYMFGAEMVRRGIDGSHDVLLLEVIDEHVAQFPSVHPSQVAA